MRKEFEIHPVALLIGLLMTVGLAIGIFDTYANRTIDSYQLTEQYEQGDDIYGERVEIVVQEKGQNLMVGGYLWEERMDVSYVTFDRVNLDWVGVGDTVVVEVSDILEVAGVYMIEIIDVEVIGQ